MVDLSNKLRGLPQKYPNVTIADWETAISAQTDLLASDGVHIGGSKGYELYTDVVLQALRTASGGNYDGGVCLTSAGGLPSEAELKQAMDNADGLPDPKGLTLSMCTAQTIKIAKVLWHFFGKDFESFITYSTTSGCHAQNKAIDMMISNYDAGAVRKRITSIAEWINNNKSTLGVNGVIYYKKEAYRDDVIGKPLSEWPLNGAANSSDPTQRHEDHIHLSVDGCNM
jgi:hypothetical protein